MSTDLNEMHQSLAVTLNQETWTLLERKDRTDKDNHRIIAYAQGSLYHWQRSPNYKSVNHQRGEWLVSHVYAVLNRGKEALAHAETCMDITINESLIDFDLAYAYECKARAYTVLRLLKKMNKCLLKAITIGSKIKRMKKKNYSFQTSIVSPGTSAIKLKNNIIIDNKIKNIFGI